MKRLAQVSAVAAGVFLLGGLMAFLAVRIASAIREEILSRRFPEYADITWPWFFERPWFIAASLTVVTLAALAAAVWLLTKYSRGFVNQIRFAAAFYS